jgi:hypothetical protein
MRLVGYIVFPGLSVPFPFKLDAPVDFAARHAWPEL